jgi:hypothetical protein
MHSKVEGVVSKGDKKDYKSETSRRNTAAVKNNRTNFQRAKQQQEVVENQPETTPVSLQHQQWTAEKRFRRNQYEKRMRELLPEGYKHLAQVSPSLDLQSLVPGTVDQRLLYYSKKTQMPSWSLF